MNPNPLDGYTIDRAGIRFVGQGLQRPECILAERDGTLWAADARGGVMRIALPGASKTEPSGTTAKGDEVVTTVSTPTDEAVADAAVSEQIAASTSWLDTTLGKVAVGMTVGYAIIWAAKKLR